MTKYFCNGEFVNNFASYLTIVISLFTLEKTINFHITFVFFLLDLTEINKKNALLQGPGNQSECRLSLLLYFDYVGLPRRKKILRF